jgi:hypothetical protein
VRTASLREIRRDVRTPQGVSLVRKLVTDIAFIPVIEGN